MQKVEMTDEELAAYLSENQEWYAERIGNTTRFYRGKKILALVSYDNAEYTRQVYLP